MQIPLNNTSYLHRIAAAFIFFTRFPFWRLCQPDKNAYRSVVEYWPLTGWLTGGIMAAIIYMGSQYVSLPLAILTAITVRILVTGALHEDGLADFFDGFGGGGNDRRRILDIMKDSRIGTYGVIALLLYLLLLFECLCQMNNGTQAAFTVLVGDPFCKMLAAQLTQMLPYARSEATAKSGIAYRRFSLGAGFGLLLQGCLPMAIVWALYRFGPLAELHAMGYLFMPIQAFFIPGLVLYFLYLLLHKKLGGYTGDCCGAVFLLIELSFYATVAIYYGLRYIE
ncbi:MAG TPA: adenosylcobinamide-GDP ribazoletransferase [Prevotella sp.]